MEGFMKFYQESNKTVMELSKIPDGFIVTSWIMIDGSWVVYSYATNVPFCPECGSNHEINGNCRYCSTPMMKDEDKECPHPCSECCGKDCAACHSDEGKTISWRDLDAMVD